MIDVVDHARLTVDAGHCNEYEHAAGAKDMYSWMVVSTRMLI